MLLGEVGQLEVEGERAQDARLAFKRQHVDRGAEFVAARSLPRRARERPHVLDGGEERLVLLLDEHAAEQVAEEAHVAPEDVGDHRHPSILGRKALETAQSGAAAPRPPR